MKPAAIFMVLFMASSLLVNNVWSQAIPDDMHVATASIEGMINDTPRAAHPFRSIDSSSRTLKAEIQALEDKWASALNTRDINLLMSMYAEDAVSMPYNSPILVGKSAIHKKQVKDFVSMPKGVTYSFETINVFGDDHLVTEVGLTTIKNGAGKTIEKGKYITIWEKRNGGYLCIREIFNTDN